MTTTEFHREDRYIVLKIKDVEELAFTEQVLLNKIEREVKSVRAARGANPDQRCVVVEEDWPEYELVWKLIEARMEGRQCHLHTTEELEEACEKSFEAGVQAAREEIANEQTSNPT